MAGLMLLSLEIEPVSLNRTLLKQKNIIILHLDYDFVSINFYQESKLSHTRNIKNGLNEMFKVVKNSKIRG